MVRNNLTYFLWFIETSLIIAFCYHPMSHNITSGGPCLSDSSICRNVLFTGSQTRLYFTFAERGNIHKLRFIFPRSKKKSPTISYFFPKSRIKSEFLPQNFLECSKSLKNHDLHHFKSQKQSKQTGRVLYWLPRFHP